MLGLVLSRDCLKCLLAGGLPVKTLVMGDAYLEDCN